MTEVKKNNANPAVTLKAQAKRFDFNKLRADQGNKLANSGKTMYLDFQRMDFIINGKKIDNNFIVALKEGARKWESELFNSGAIHDIDVRYNDIFNEEGTREIDTDHGQAFVDSVLKDIEKGLAEDALAELWEEHCKKHDTTAEQKTDSYRQEFERFYNAGQKYIHLVPLEKVENKNYRSFAKEIFIELFKHVGTEIPSDPILEELVTNCNQSAYLGALYHKDGPLTRAAEIHELLFGSSHTTHIDCTDSNHVTVKSSEIISVRNFNNPEEEVGKIDSSLEFILESQNDQESVTYNDGKLSLTVPRELENYHVNNEEEPSHSDVIVKKSLLDHIVERFLVIIEKLLNIKPENRQKFHEGIKNALSRSNSSEAIVIKDTGCSPFKIECSLGQPLKVNSRLESLKPPIQCDEHVPHAG
jgi:hypothetical protein